MNAMADLNLYRHLDEMTQANAALAEQSAASAGALSGRIGELNTLVASFRTGTGTLSASRCHTASAANPLRLVTAAPIDEPQRLRQLA